MSSDSIFKDIIRSFFNSLFKVVAFGFGIVILFVLFTTLSGTRAVPHATTVDVLPNHEWHITPFSTETPTILQISINGIIGLDSCSYENVKTQLIESLDVQMKPDQVRAVFVHINTPGGIAEQADGIYRTLLEYKRRKNVPIYAYVDGLCASGGMYIACASDKILATQDSLVGHVGVILPTFFNFSSLMDKLGIETKTIYSGKDKDNMNPFRPWTPGESQPLQKISNFVYDRFTTIVSQHRPLLTKEVLHEQGAQIYPAPEAEKVGYIDGRVASMDEALLLLAKEVGIEENYQLVELKLNNFFADLFGSDASSLFKGKVEHTIRIAGDIRPELYGKPLYMWLPQNSTTK
jgi:protease IV